MTTLRSKQAALRHDHHQEASAYRECDSYTYNIIVSNQCGTQDSRPATAPLCASGARSSSKVQPRISLTIGCAEASTQFFQTIIVVLVTGPGSEKFDGYTCWNRLAVRGYRMQ